jgi:hypothetical protein
VDFERQRGAIIPWIPAMVGVGIMIGLLVAILAWSPEKEQPVTAASEAAPPVVEAPPPPPVPQVSQGVGTGPTSASPPAPPAPPPPPATSAARRDGVTGQYKVISSYGDSFIAEVLLVNSEGRPQDWTVRLVFPDNVGELRAFWVDGVPQPKLRRSGQTYTFTSTVPIGARSSLQLKFDFSRTGRNNDPLSCTTNGVACRKG